MSGVGEIRTGRRAASSSTRASSAWSSIGLSSDSISCVHCEMECTEENEAMVYLILFLVVADELFATFALAKILELWLGFVGVAQLVWIRRLGRARRALYVFSWTLVYGLVCVL